MAYQAKSYKKFVATAATATLVASAIAPVASADEVSTAAFTDVPDRYEPAIEYVVEEGIAKGLTATQFGISESIKRGDAAIMLATAADLIDPDAPVAPFTDVPTRGQLAVGSLYAENVVNGYDEDTFGFSANITRGEAAYMLAEAYNLYDFVNVDEVDLDFTDVPSRFEAAVKALVAFEITQGVTPTQFGADDYIKRGDFAVFLYRLNQAFSDTVAPELSFDFDVDTAIEVGVGEEFVLPEVTAIDDIDGEITVVPVITNEAGEEVDAVDTSAPGTYYITYTAIDAAGNVSEVVVEVVVVEAGISTVAAVTPDSVELTFAQPVEELSRTDVVVTDESGARVYVESVELAEDGLSAVVNFYDDLTSDTTYSFEVAAGEDTLAYDFDFIVTDVAEIVAEDQVVNAAVPTQIEYFVYDESGINLTEDVDVSFESPSDAIDPDTGVVTGLEAGTSTTVTVVYTNNDVVVESETVTITSVDAEVETLANFTVAGDTPVDFAAVDYEQNTDVFADEVADFLQVQFEDQFGNVFTPAAGSVVFESLNTEVAVVDELTGEIQAFTTGTLPVRVAVVDGEEILYSTTVEVEVFAEREASDIELADASVTLSSLDDVGVAVDAAVLDQYANLFDAPITVTEDVENLEVTYADGQLVIAAADGTEVAAGTYTVDLSVAGTDVTEELTVTVVEPGVFAAYELRGEEAVLDLNDDVTSQLSLVAVDNDGLFIQDETADASYVVLNAEGEVVVPSAALGTQLDVSTLEVGAYEVVVSLGDAVVAEYEVEVIDTTVEPEVTYNSNVVTTTDAVDFGTAFRSIVEIDGAAVQDSTDLYVDFVSANDAVVNDETGDTNVGSTEVYVTSLRIDVNGDTTFNADGTVLSADGDDVIVSYDSPIVFLADIDPAAQ